MSSGDSGTYSYIRIHDDHRQQQPDEEHGLIVNSNSNSNNQNHYDNYSLGSSSTSTLLPQYHHNHEQNHSHHNQSLQQPLYLVKMSFRQMMFGNTLLTGSAFIFCVFWALYEDFDLATKTLCDGHMVPNYLPSFSAATGQFEVSKAIWRMSISVNSFPRFLWAAMYFSYLKSVLSPTYRPWRFVLLTLNCLENLGLMGLSYFSSNENYYVHEKCFYIFLICGEIYMVILCCVSTWGRRKPAQITPTEAFAIKLRWRFLLLILLCTLSLNFIYERHIGYCERGVYTIFSLVEYVVVFSNMAYHYTAYWDFYNRVMYF